MKGFNICAWIKVGELATCDKSCCGTYCKIHLAKIRKGRQIPARCRSCGVGVQSDIQLCRDCGREKVRVRLLAKEKKARQYFQDVMRELTERGRELTWEEENRRALRKLCLPCMRMYPDRCRVCLRDTLQYRLITTAIKAPCNSKPN
jgi:hypothetical protein